jgi:hypothetical protein
MTQIALFKSAVADLGSLSIAIFLTMLLWNPHILRNPHTQTVMAALPE